MTLINPQYIWQAFPEIIKGIPLTLEITVIAFIIGSLIGFACALVRLRNLPIAKQVVTIYLSIIRGTPLLVQIFLAYYGLPIFIEGINERFGTTYDISTIPALLFCFVSFSLNMGAFMTEIFRSAILSVDPGQMEAARTMGMNDAQAI
ncbi:MAG: ABC transporter permease subunit [Bifidobacterium scardovii]|uniref:ABC transporter permease subunit n=1 Tax=Bifidobacterium scardovii TaxID=158787 RepID=UPI00290188C1|nr:ABC transporter permease subunit [Bifidobacterium scardovii]MDU2421113.1 ABC transporter permease subunit [Bifidobacterium scardovii]